MYRNIKNVCACARVRVRVCVRVRVREGSKELGEKNRKGIRSLLSHQSLDFGQLGGVTRLFKI